jgi:transcriptional regulator with PAS, ATPase and Fis domain
MVKTILEPDLVGRKLFFWGGGMKNDKSRSAQGNYFYNSEDSADDPGIDSRSPVSLLSDILDESCRSEAMKIVIAQITSAAKCEAPVLLLGETGSGKDYWADIIHRNSKRFNGPFVTVNCSALSSELIESELFGHEAGAFTGAKGRKKGFFELAHGGVLVLNEIGEMPLSLQSKLLTFLDTKEFYRVGGEKSVHVDVTVIAATNRDLSKDIDTGAFRRDLFHRLDVLTIRIPPLRARMEDMWGLSKKIWQDLVKEYHVPETLALSPDIIQALSCSDWPGNVRELKNVLQRLLLCNDYQQYILGSISTFTDQQPWTHTVHFPDGKSMNDIIREVRQSILFEALRRTGNNQKAAAKLIGVSYVSMRHYLRSQKPG